MKTTIDSASTPSRKGALLPPVFRWFSPHCVLRQIDSADVARIWKAVLHPAFEHCFSVPVPQSERDVSDFVQSAQSDWRRGTRYVMAVQRKQTHEFVGWVEASSTGGSQAPAGVWSLNWFIHPSCVTSSLALEALTSATDLTMNALAARLIRADCDPRYAHFERLLRAAGFGKQVPAGSLDPDTARPRARALFVMTRLDWHRVRNVQSSTAPLTLGGYAQPGAELTLL